MRLTWRRLFLPVCIAILLSAAVTVPLPAFAERPGAVLSLTELIDVAAADGEFGEVDGDFLLPLVNLRRATVALFVVGVVSDDVTLVPVVGLTGGLDDATYFGRQREIFDATGDMAAALGLQAAGYPVEFGPARGVLVAGVFPGAPADGALQAGDIVTSVGDAPVRSSGELVAAVRESRAETLEVAFTRDDEERRVRITRGQVAGLDQPGIGVRAEDLVPTFELPVPVELDSGRVGGPSAGLMIALTVYDTVADEDLAGGRRVAGTGGVVADGTVTRIGSIELKVVAVDRQGAEIFLVPASQLDAARQAVPEGSDLRVIGVETVQDAIETLRDTGEGSASAAVTVP